MKTCVSESVAQTPGQAQQPRGRNGAQVLIDTLAELGVEVIFGYPGGAVLDIES
jgi:hypothetical protein